MYLLRGKDWEQKSSAQAIRVDSAFRAEIEAVILKQIEAINALDPS